MRQAQQRVRLLLSLAVLLALGPATLGRAAPADATARGRYAVTHIEYDAGLTLLGPETQGAGHAASQPVPAQLHGSVHLPSSARGRLPVVVLLHGRAGACSVVGTETVGYPCPEAVLVRPVRSYAGFDYLASNLASHGYLVLSVDANGVNSYDAFNPDGGTLARAQLISRSLDLLAKWDISSGPGAVGQRLLRKVDLRRIGLLGHSRGGEAAAYWLAYNRTRSDGPRYRVGAVLSLAPTDITGQLVAGVPLAVVLPLCDGVVTDLQGARVYERSKYADPADRAPKYQFAVEGANHNWFNSEWGDDDAAERADAACNPSHGRGLHLTRTHQQRAFLALAGAFLRRHVGGERAFDAALTGRVPWTSACAPGLPMPCRDLLRTSYQPPAAQRHTVVRPLGTTVTSDRGPITATRFIEYRYCDDSSSSGPPCPERGDLEYQDRGGRSHGPQLSVRWEGLQRLRLQSGSPVDVRRYAALVLRSAVNFSFPVNPVSNGVQPRSATQDFLVTLTDSRGRSQTTTAARWTTALTPPVGDNVRNQVLADVRVPVSAFRRIDLSRVTSVTLTFGTRRRTGWIQLADIAFAS